VQSVTGLEVTNSWTSEKADWNFGPVSLTRGDLEGWVMHHTTQPADKRRLHSHLLPLLTVGTHTLRTRSVFDCNSASSLMTFNSLEFS